MRGDAPAGYWRLDETSGTTAADTIGGNAGTYSGGVTLGIPGAVAGDTAASFDGTGQVTVPDSASLHTGDTFTEQFTVAGTVEYFCAIHPMMTGKIVVTP